MLPQELLDEIVAWLSDDRPSLMALACTAQCLRACSQELLFHELVLTPNTKSPSSYMPLLEMSPHILSYVRRLRIDTTEPLGSMVPRERLYVVEDNYLSHLFEAFINVDCIEVAAGIYAYIALGRLLPVISSPRVRYLTLNGIFLDTLQSIFAILSYFPFLTSLRLHSVSLLNYRNITVTEESILAAMGTSILNNAASGRLTHLHGFIIESYSTRELFLVSKLIPHLPSLITLTMKGPMDDISHPVTQQRLAVEIPVFPLQKIQSLRLSLPGFTSSWTGWWLSHLTEAAAVRLEYLAIDFLYAGARVASEMQQSMAEWKDVEMTLMCLPRLKSVNMKTVIAGR
ncbi:hypothetical protein BDZ89DRAFT_1075792 [Hymenopellis radicata]|nr:hypothetical protein BDZ89DRAFT_1075792 [Hymenopellis radicata]